MGNLAGARELIVAASPQVLRPDLLPDNRGIAGADGGVQILRGGLAERTPRG